MSTRTITSSDGTYGDNSTGTPSQNGRYISRARWNKPLLLPPTSATNLTPAIVNGASFVPPDWVLQARDGSNPTAWSAGLIDTGTNSTAVVGRYAYNIYDEGGLLDATVAGYPDSVPATQAADKISLAFADLTQLDRCVRQHAFHPRAN